MGNFGYLADKSVIFALICTALIAACAGILGVVLVLRRYSMLGDGLSHIAFGAYAVATAMSFADNMLLTVPVTIIVAILMLKIREDGKIKGETVIAMLSTGSLAIGYMVMHLAGGNNVAGDVCTTLFGGNAILCLTAKDVGVCCGLAVGVALVFLLFYNRIFAVALDETVAKATGIKVGAYKTLLAATIAIVIVLAMELVGALLISALVVFPALTAMRFTKSFRATVITSAAISTGTAIIGLLFACVVNTPIGPTIVIANVAVFLIAYLISTIVGKKGKTAKAAK